MNIGKLIKDFAADAVYLFFALGVILYAVFFIGDEEPKET